MFSKKQLISLITLLLFFAFAHAQVDLTVSNVSTNSNFVNTGSFLMITATISNSGTSTANSSSAGIYVSNDNILDQFDYYISSSYCGSIAPNGSYAMSSGVIFPNYMPTGNMYVIVKADYQNQIIETNENNNAGYSSTPIFIKQPFIDFSVELVSSTPNSTVSGTNISVTGSIKNNGYDVSEMTTPIGIYLSTNTTYESGDEYLGSAYINNVSPNNSISYNSTLTIPIGTVAGTYYLVHYADYQNMVKENNENNNTGYSSLIITGSLSLDLTIPSSVISSKSSIPAGTSTNISVTISNTGTTASVSGSVGYYLSTNTTYDANDVYLSNGTFSTINGNSSVNSSTTSTLIPTATTPGTYYIVAKADYQGLINETNEANNANYVTVTITKPIIDFTTSNYGLAFSQSLVNQGGATVVNSLIYNNGTSESGPGTVKYYISNDPYYDASDVFLKNDSFKSIPGGDALGTNGVTVNIPSNTPIGTNYIILVIDSPNLISETNENNNTFSTKIIINSPGIDLYNEGGALYNSKVIGDYITVDIAIHNYGVISSGSGFTGYYLSKNNSYDMSDVYLGNLAFPSIAGGETYQSKGIGLQIPTNTLPGTYYILYIVDYQNLITEYDESNNLKTQDAILVAATVDLSIPNNLTGVPSSISAGSTISPSSYIINTGNFYSSAGNVGYYLSINNSYDANDIYLGNSTFPTIYGPNGYFTSNATSLIIPQNTTPSNYFIVAKVDYQNLITETNEANNSNYTPISISSITDINDEQSSNSVNIYPNPSKGSITIATGDNHKTVAVRINSITGTEVFNQTLTENKTIDISNLSAGIYIVEIISNSKSEIRKLIKE